MQNYIFQQPEGWYQKFGRNFLASVHIAHIQRPPSFYLYFQRERTDDSPRLHIISLYTRFFISPEFEIVKFFLDTQERSCVGLGISDKPPPQIVFQYVSNGGLLLILWINHAEISVKPRINSERSHSFLAKPLLLFEKKVFWFFMIIYFDYI